MFTFLQTCKLFLTSAVSMRERERQRGPDRISSSSKLVRIIVISLCIELFLMVSAKLLKELKLFVLSIKVYVNPFSPH